MKVKAETIDNIKLIFEFYYWLLKLAITGSIAFVLPILPIGMFDREYINLMLQTNNLFYFINIQFVIAAIVIMQYYLLNLGQKVLGNQQNSSLGLIVTYIVKSVIFIGSWFVCKSTAIFCRLTDKQTVSTLIPVCIITVTIFAMLSVFRFAIRRGKGEKIPF